MTETDIWEMSTKCQQCRGERGRNKQSSGNFYGSGNMLGAPIMAQRKQIQLGTMRLWVQSLASLSGLRIWCYRELWCRSWTRLRSGVAWCRPVATAPIQPLAWESSYAMSAALKGQKTKKKKNPFVYHLG